MEVFCFGCRMVTLYLAVQFHEDETHENVSICTIFCSYTAIINVSHNGTASQFS
jgi:hypothetical protein